MKFISIFLILGFSSTCFSFDPIDLYPGYVPDFNLSSIDFCEDAMNKSAKRLKESENQKEIDYLNGYRDAFHIMYYFLEAKENLHN